MKVIAPNLSIINKHNLLIVIFVIISLVSIKGIGIKIEAGFTSILLSRENIIDVSYNIFMILLILALNKLSLYKLYKELNNTIQFRKFFIRVTFNVIASGLLILGFTTIYFSLADVKWADTLFFSTDLPIAALLTLMGNLIYVGLLFKQPVEQQNEKKILGSSESSDQVLTKDPSSKETIKKLLIYQGKTLLPIEINSVAYFYKVGDSTFIRTFLNQEHRIENTLEQLEQTLNTNLFFRANRQFILNQKAIKQVDQAEHRKLNVFLKPGNDIPIVVSQKRASLFKHWLKKSASI